MADVAEATGVFKFVSQPYEAEAPETIDIGEAAHMRNDADGLVDSLRSLPDKGPLRNVARNSGPETIDVLQDRNNKRIYVVETRPERVRGDPLLRGHYSRKVKVSCFPPAGTFSDELSTMFDQQGYSDRFD